MWELSQSTNSFTEPGQVHSLAYSPRLFSVILAELVVATETVGPPKIYCLTLFYFLVFGRKSLYPLQKSYSKYFWGHWKTLEMQDSQCSGVDPVQHEKTESLFLKDMNKNSHPHKNIFHGSSLQDALSLSLNVSAPQPWVGPSWHTGVTVIG